MSKIKCMVTGGEVDSRQITAGHIYRQGWPTGVLVSTLTPKYSIAFHRVELCTNICSILTSASEVVKPV